MNRILTDRQSEHISGRTGAGAVRVCLLRSASVMLICIMLLITFGYSVSPAAWAVRTDNTASASAKTPTVISGYKTSIRKMYKQDVTISAEIYPASVKRKVKLQRYNSTEQKWETIRKEYVKSKCNYEKMEGSLSTGQRSGEDTYDE